jgi:thiol-disulfide isomerase/thioredoxin
MTVASRLRPGTTALAVGWSVAAVLTLAGCSRVDSAGGDGYVTAERSVLVLAEDERGEPVSGVSGTTVDGKPFDLDESLKGSTETVVNVWGSWCVPCRSEADDLVDAEARLAKDKVQFLGIDVRDSPSEAQAFQRRFKVTWPSLDDPGGRTLLAFRGVPSKAIPTTWVLDDQGRIGARIVNEVDAATLADVVADVRAGDVSSDGADG